MHWKKNHNSLFLYWVKCTESFLYKRRWKHKMKRRKKLLSNLETRRLSKKTILKNICNTPLKLELRYLQYPTCPLEIGSASLQFIWTSYQQVDLWILSVGNANMPTENHFSNKMVIHLDMFGLGKNKYKV